MMMGSSERRNCVVKMTTNVLEKALCWTGEGRTRLEREAEVGMEYMDALGNCQQVETCAEACNI